MCIYVSFKWIDILSHLIWKRILCWLWVKYEVFKQNVCKINIAEYNNYNNKVIFWLRFKKMEINFPKSEKIFSKAAYIGTTKYKNNRPWWAWNEILWKVFRDKIFFRKIVPGGFHDYSTINNFFRLFNIVQNFSKCVTITYINSPSR